jgi:ribosomal protein S18 acetylase RimI-like enzyme
MIRHIEEISLSALPALQTVYCDGWVLRFAGGHTRRANSVNPLYPSTLDIGEKIAYCEALYHAQGLPAVFKLTDAVNPPDLDAILAERGYQKSPPTSVQTMRLNGTPIERPATIDTLRSGDWLDAYARMNDVPLHRRDVLGRMLDGLITPSGYAAVEVNGEIAAVGLGVLTQDYVGLFDIVTAAQVRRQGLGRRIVASLLKWGQDNGARHAYLQVVADNIPAVGLYRSLGFSEAYPYWYREKRQ